MKTTILIFALIILGSCKHQTPKKRNDNSNILSTEIKEKDSLLISEKKIKQFLANTKDIRIIEFNKSMIETSMPDSTVCKKWNLKEEDVIEIIKKNKSISKEELHYLFDMNTCVYNGKMTYNNKNYDFTINSGGYIYINYNNIRLGCFTGDCTKYFLTTGED